MPKSFNAKTLSTQEMTMGLLVGALTKRTGNIYEQLEGFLVNIHLDKVDMQALHSLSLSLSHSQVSYLILKLHQIFSEE